METKSVMHEEGSSSESLVCDRIVEGERFDSFTEFEAQLKNYENKTFSNFRIGSSEYLKCGNGKPHPQFKYRYVVLHCVHFGAPRRRGKVLRPNQRYLPSYCQVTLRLNYSVEHRCLYIAVFKPQHNHATNAQTFVRKRHTGSRLNSNSSTIEGSSTTSKSLIQSQRAKQRRGVKKTLNKLSSETVCHPTGSNTSATFDF